MLNLKFQTILEIGFAIRAPKMSISFLDIFSSVKEAAEKCIASAFSVHHRNLNTIVQANSYLHGSWRLLFDIILDCF